MKKLLLSVLFLSLMIGAKAQNHGTTINWGLSGTYRIDSCNFNSGCSLIIIDTSAQNIWQQGISNKSFFGNTKGIFTDSTHVYPIGNHSIFTLYFTNINWGNLIFQFDHKFETDSAKDGGYIEYYIGGDSSWHNVLSNCNFDCPDAINTQNFYSNSDSIINQEIGFSGTSNWMTSYLEIIRYYPARMKSGNNFGGLRFHFISDSVQTNKAGWIIKNFQIYLVDLGSGINEIKNDVANIFPNPTSSSFTIKKSTNENLQFHLYNLIGQNVWNENLTNETTTIERNGSPANAYLFSITNQEGKIVQTGKVIFE